MARDTGADDGTSGRRFDFDRVVDRRGTNSAKWAGQDQFLQPDEIAADPLPMWVADADFRSPPQVVDALREVVDHGVFGYPAGAPDSYVRAVVDWQQRRFGWSPEPEWVLQSAGVVTSIKIAIHAFTAPGDSVLIQPPVYGPFHEDVLANGRRLALAPLERTERGYRFDPVVFEAAIRPDTRLFVLCSPHNPTGNVWSEDDLRTMGEICRRHDVLVLSDEIHQDLVMDPQLGHVPYASLGDEFASTSITCTSPSKTFNLAGLQSSNVFIPDPRLRDEFQRVQGRIGSPWMNSLGLVAAEAAYTHGEPWLEELLAYVRENQRHFATAVNGVTDLVEVLPMDALYLAWIDCRPLGMTPEELDRFMLLRARLWLERGPKFGAEGAGYMRINLGCPRATVDEAISRLTDAIAELDA